MSVAFSKDCTIGSPSVRFGTKWLSMTSTCSQSAPVTAAASSARWAKSADRMLGAINTVWEATAESLSIEPADHRAAGSSYPPFGPHFPKGLKQVADPWPASGTIVPPSGPKSTPSPATFAATYGLTCGFGRPPVASSALNPGHTTKRRFSIIRVADSMQAVRIESPASPDPDGGTTARQLRTQQ